MKRRGHALTTMVLLVAACTSSDEAKSTTTTMRSATSATTTTTTTTTTTPDLSTTTEVQPPTSGSSTDFSRDPKAIHSDRGSSLTDVRVARQAGVDRVVFEFEGDVPETAVSYGTQPASDECVPPPDDAPVFLNLVIGSSMRDGSGVRTYVGPDRVSDGTTAAVASLVLTCDFEGHLSATVPLDREWPFALYTLDDPARVVIDVATGG